MAYFEFYETMSGGYRLRGEASAPMSFTVRAQSPSISKFLREPRAFLEGEIDAEGFADHRPLRGTIGLDFLRTRRIPYALTFDCNEGKGYRFEGHKTISLLSLIKSMTHLPGKLIDADSGRDIGEAYLQFDLEGDLEKFIKSFRLWR